MSQKSKNIHGVEMHSLLDKEKVMNAAVRKEDHADSLLEHERIHNFWFAWKRRDSKQYLLLLISKGKFTLFIEWLLYVPYMNIC